MATENIFNCKTITVTQKKKYRTMPGFSNSGPHTLYYLA